MSEHTIQCWSCGTSTTLNEIRTADGYCPECEVEIDLAEYYPKLAADYDALHAEAEALRVALLGIASANPAERGIEWAKSYASDGLKGAGSELYGRWLDSFKEAEALQRKVTELTNQRDAILLQARCWAGEAKAQQAITKAVGEALGGVPNWGPIAAGVEALRAELAATKKKLSVAQQFSPRIIGCNCGEYVPEGYLCACERGIL